MDLKTLFAVDIENIKKQQHTALKQAVIQRINKVKELVEKEKYSDVLEMLEYSPSGDGYGCDNHYIDFSDIADVCGIQTRDGTDIETVIGVLQELKGVEND